MAEECSIQVDTIENQTSALSSRDGAFLDRLKEQVNEINSGMCGSKTTPKITTVPKMMFQNESYQQYYKPREMALGTLHQHDLDESIKLKLAAKFINSSGRTAEILLLGIKNNINDLNKLFPENSYNSDDDHLARLLCLDGCAVLQFIFSYNTKKLKEFDINNGQAAVIRQDLFLLENQIPFRVLNILFDLIDHAHDYRISVFKFVLVYNITENADNYENLSRPNYLAWFYKQHEPVHLLGLLHSIFVYGGGLYEHLISIEGLRKMSHKDQRIFDSSLERSFRNVQELKEAGIEVIPSNFNALNSVRFTSKFFATGQLKFPPFIVDNSTEQKLLNLVAYEMSRDDYESKYCWVVSYVNLLDLLIDSEQDVKDLRAARVLRNRLSNDAEVAQLFNRLGSICSAPPQDEYFPVKNKLQMHYERKSAVWVAQVYHDHFRSPWTVLALLAALIALVLTGVQTWYAVNPKN